MFITLILCRHTLLDVPALCFTNKSRQPTLLLYQLSHCRPSDCVWMLVFYVCIRPVGVCIVIMLVECFDGSRQGAGCSFLRPWLYSVSQEMATSDPCANAPPTPPEEPEPSPSLRKKRGRRKLDQTERNKGIDLMRSHIILNMTLVFLH